jgi:hypothetical protein
MVLYRVSVPVLTWDNYWVEADSPEEAFKKVNTEDMTEKEWESADSDSEGMEWIKPEDSTWFVLIEDSGNLFNFNKSVEET